MNYLIIGDDDYLRQAETAKIKDRFLTPSQIELNYSVHEYDDINGILNSVSTMPFLADKRVVVVKEAHRFTGESIEAVLSYLAKPMAQSVLVLSSEASFRDRKEYAKLSKLADVIDASTPDPLTIKRWVCDFFKKEKIEIDPDAIELLMELKGSDTSGIKAELEKIISFSCGDRITSKHIESLVGRSVRENIFKLVDAINQNSPGRVFRIISDLYEEKKEPPEIIGYLAWHIRQMQKIVFASDKKMNLEAISGKIGYSPKYTKVLLDQSKRYPVTRINKWLSSLFEADKDLKTGKKEGRFALEMLLVSLCNS